MKAQSSITNVLYISIGIVITLIVIYFLYSYLINSSLETITSPFVISNFILNNFQEQTSGSCSFAISFDANQNINLASIDAGFLLSNGEYLYPSYGNYTQTTSFINAGQYLYYLKPTVGWFGYNGSVCKFLSTAITSKSNYIIGMTKIIDNKTKIFQRFTGNVEFLVNTPNTNPQDIYGDSVIGITATHNLGVVIIKGITNSTFSEDTTPGTYIYLPIGKYQITYTSEGSGAIFLEWDSDGGVLIQNPQYQQTNMTIINNGQIIIDNTLSIIPPVNFNITENQTETLVGNKVNVTADYVSGYYTFYVNKLPYSGCVDTQSKTCIITESSPGTYNITASYKSSTVYGVSNTLQEVYFYPFAYMSIQNTQSIATSSPFQQEIIFDANNYRQYESANLGNIRIVNSQNQQVNFWCESGCYNSSTRTIIFMDIVNGIPAFATQQYKIEFLNKSVNYNGTTAGEAPQLSSTYAKHDNGKYVFNSYWNFAGTSFPIGLIESTNGGTITINNGITISVPGYDYGLNYIETPDIIGTGNITEVSWETIQTGVGYATVNIPSIVLTNNWAKQQSYSFDNYYNGTNPPHMFAYYGTDNTTIGTRLIATNRYSQNGNIWSIAINSAGNLAYMSYTDYGSAPVQIYGPSTEVALSNDYSAVITTQTGTTQLYYLLTRSYPPNGVMPTVSIGTIQQ